LTPLEVLAAVEAELASAGVPEPRTDAELLVAHVLGCARSTLYSAPAALTDEENEQLWALVERRVRREPVQYLLGEWGFRRLTLTVDRRALIPRPETEIVVERCLVLLEGRETPRVLDVGTGSGAIALALVDEHPGARVVATDVSPDALSLARENAERTKLADRVEFVQGHLLDTVEGPFDLVVSNPPYVLAEDVHDLAPEIREWEPPQALSGEGLSEAIAQAARDVLVSGGALVLETAELRAAEVAGLLRSLGYEDVLVTLDLAGAERVVEGRFGSRASRGAP
jgi:release factor glutamine methyltransferase